MKHVHTDIVSHSTNNFPTRTGQDFLEFLKAHAAGDPAHLLGSPREKYLGSHLSALTSVEAPKPPPSSFARETYFGLIAMHRRSARD
jgi:catalase